WGQGEGAGSLAQRVQRLAHGVATLGGAEGLDQTWDSNALEKRLGLRAQCVTREEDKARQGLRLARLQSVIETWTIELRHAQVAQNQVIRLRLQESERLTPVPRRVDLVAVTAEYACQPACNADLVIDNENSGWGCWGRERHGGLRDVWRRHGRNWELDTEHGA